MNFFKSFTSIKLPEKNILISLLEEVLTVLSSENEVYRPKTKDGNLGGMLIFNDELPTILVPDLHARYNFLQKLFSYKNLFDKKKSVYELMQENQLRVICVGDGLHSEKRGKDRWLKAYEEYLNGNTE